MKGKIDEHGFLRIYRGDANPKYYQSQGCPYTSNENGPTQQCGQWCPHFGEPIFIDVFIDVESLSDVFENTIGYKWQILLDLCHNKKLLFDEFEVMP